MAYSASAQTNAPVTLRTSPPVTIGGYDDRPAYAFSRVVAGSVIAEGEVAIVDRVAREIRVFNVQGAHLRTFGREGQGPGEFQFLRTVQPFAVDRLAAWDFQVKRLSVFSFEGEHESTTTVTMEPMARLWSDYVGSFSDGSFVLRNNPNEMVLKDEPSGYRTDPTSFVRYSPEGEELDVLCIITGPERFLYHDDGSWGLEERLLERSVVGFVAGDILYCGSTESLDLRRVDRRGYTLPSVVVPREPVEASREEVERLRQLAEDRILLAQERRARTLSSAPFAFPDNTEAHLERLERRQAYRTRPAFRGVVGTSRGVLWVEDYGAPGREVALWARLEGSEVTGWLEVPGGESVLDIDHGVLVTLSEDDLGVHSVLVRRIVDPDV